MSTSFDLAMSSEEAPSAKIRKNPSKPSLKTLTRIARWERYYMALLSLEPVKFQQIYAVIPSVTFLLNNKYKFQLKVNTLPFYQDNQPVNPYPANVENMVSF